MPSHRAHLFALALLATLAACGGGGESSSSSSVNVASRSGAQSVSASGAVMPNDSTEAAGITLATAKAVVAAGSTTQTVGVAVVCLGGGGATYTVTGPNTGLLVNGQLDTGESYTLSFNNCRGAAGAAVVNGTMTLLVTSATTGSLTVNTSTVNLSVALPLRTLTLNGSSTLTQTSANSGSNTSLTTRWVSPSIRVDSQRNTGGSTHYELRNVDYARNSIVTVNGVPVSSSCEGSSTLEARLFFFPWFITLAILDPINYGPTGAVLTGRWAITLPDDYIELQITPLSVSLRVDLGRNGTFDLSFFFSLDEFFTAGG